MPILIDTHAAEVIIDKYNRGHGRESLNDENIRRDLQIPRIRRQLSIISYQ